MVARDRIAAMLITHMTPAMVTSGLYGNYTVLNNYITYYKDQVKLNVTSNAESYKKKIIDLAPSLGFRKFDEKMKHLRLGLMICIFILNQWVMISLPTVYIL